MQVKGHFGHPKIVPPGGQKMFRLWHPIKVDPMVNIIILLNLKILCTEFFYFNFLTEKFYTDSF